MAAIEAAMDLEFTGIERVWMRLRMVLPGHGRGPGLPLVRYRRIPRTGHRNKLMKYYSAVGSLRTSGVRSLAAAS